MKSETEENFWKAWSEPVLEPAPIFFRLYYDEHGDPLYYSMEDLPGNYIDIDAETYAYSSFQVRVVDKKLVRIVPKRTVKKLYPSESGVPCHKDDVSIVVDTTQPHTNWSLKTNESN